MTQGLATLVANALFPKGQPITRSQCGYCGMLLFGGMSLSLAATALALYTWLPGRTFPTDWDYVLNEFFKRVVIAVPPAILCGLITSTYRYECHVGKPVTMVTGSQGVQGRLGMGINALNVVGMAVLALGLHLVIGLLCILPAWLVSLVGRRFGKELYHSGTFAIVALLLTLLIIGIRGNVSEPRELQVYLAVYGAAGAADASLDFFVVQWAGQRRLASPHGRPVQYSLGGLLSFVFCCSGYVAVLVVLFRN